MFTISQIHDLYNTGNKTLSVVLQNGETKKLRLFLSNANRLCYFGKGKRHSGYPISGIIEQIVSIKPVDKPKETVLDQYINNLLKFKKAFTVNAHPNLWWSLRDSYDRLDINDFRNFVIEHNPNPDSNYDLYTLMNEYCKNNKLDIISENHYKITTIKSNKPRYFIGEYNNYLANVKHHLDNMEDFRYHWNGNYDVSVSGRVTEAGFYCAWFSLEYRGCGNGHYYLLINENQAVFCEDD